MKKDYVYDRQAKKVRIIDESKLFALLLRHGLVDAYEHFILQQESSSLGDFLRDCKISGKEMNAISLYTVSVGDALTESRALTKIQAFIKNKHHRAYIPGSSLKGALRTVILHELMDQDQNKQERELIFLDEKGNLKINEAKYLNTLQYNTEKAEDEINSIMRTIAVSDSSTASNHEMILARKDDLSVVGNQNTLNLVRECIAPGVTLHATLTVDTLISRHTAVSNGQKIDGAWIANAIKNYSNYYNQSYLRHFKNPKVSIPDLDSDCIVLGGGSGYFGKNLMYTILGKEKGLQRVSGIMKKNFSGHHHEEDEYIGISPHMLKCGTVNGRLMHYGICRIAVKERDS